MPKHEQVQARVESRSSDIAIRCLMADNVGHQARASAHVACMPLFGMAA